MITKKGLLFCTLMGACQVYAVDLAVNNNSNQVIESNFNMWHKNSILIDNKEPISDLVYVYFSVDENHQQDIKLENPGLYFNKDITQATLPILVYGDHIDEENEEISIYWNYDRILDPYLTQPNLYFNSIIDKPISYGTEMFYGGSNYNNVIEINQFSQISQNIKTKAGQTYQLKLSYTSHDYSPEQYNFMVRVYNDEDIIEEQMVYVDSLDGTFIYKTTELMFVADSDNSRIEIVTEEQGYQGILIDYLSVKNSNEVDGTLTFTLSDQSDKDINYIQNNIELLQQQNDSSVWKNLSQVDGMPILIDEYYTDYITALSNQNINDIVDISHVVDTVNTDLGLREIFEDSKSRSGNFNRNNQFISYEKLSAIRGIQYVSPKLIEDYQYYIQNENEFTEENIVVMLQEIIDRVNLSSFLRNLNNNDYDVQSLLVIAELDDVYSNNMMYYDYYIKQKLKKRNTRLNVQNIQEIIDYSNLIATVIRYSHSFYNDEVNSYDFAEHSLFDIPGITDVLAQYYPLYQDRIIQVTDFNKEQVVSILNDIIKQVNDSQYALETVLEVAKNGEYNDTFIEELKKIIGIRHVIDIYVPFYAYYFKNLNFVNDVVHLKEIQSVIDTVNLKMILSEVLEDSRSKLGADNFNGVLVNSDMLSAVMKLNFVKTSALHQSLYQDLIVKEKGFSNPINVLELQTLIDKANLYVDKLSQVYLYSMSNDDIEKRREQVLYIDDLYAIYDLQNIVPDLEEQYITAISEYRDFSYPIQLNELQLLIDKINVKALQYEDNLSDEIKSQLNEYLF